MSDNKHHYHVKVEWTGNRGTGTSGYRDYDRNHLLIADGKIDIDGSSDPQFRGDESRWNPEELLVGSLSACHKLWYLHLCAVSGVRVEHYVDEAEGIMEMMEGDTGRFTKVILRPTVHISQGDAEKAEAPHAMAHEKCFIAKSVNFEVEIILNIISA